MLVDYVKDNYHAMFYDPSYYRLSSYRLNVEV